jgi:hypothetical protein
MDHGLIVRAQHRDVHKQVTHHAFASRVIGDRYRSSVGSESVSQVR